VQLRPPTLIALERCQCGDAKSGALCQRLLRQPSSLAELA
jgi:hypothetical protein